MHELGTILLKFYCKDNKKKEELKRSWGKLRERRRRARNAGHFGWGGSPCLMMIIIVVILLIILVIRIFSIVIRIISIIICISGFVIAILSLIHVATI